MQSASSSRFKRAQDRKFIGFDYANEGKWSGPYSFVQLADSQIGMMASIVSSPNGSIKGPPMTGEQGTQREIQMLIKAVAIINGMHPRPEFIIVCGDLVDPTPDCPDQASKFEIFKSVLDQVHESIALVCVCGNHDVGNNPSRGSIQEYTKQFGSDYFSFWVRGVKCLVLNSQAFNAQEPEITEEQDTWIQRELDAQETRLAKHVIVFSHIPPFVFDPNEKSAYFNVRTDRRLRLLNAFVDAGVGSWFCGHFHRNAGGWYRRGGSKLEVIVTAAIGTNLKSDPVKDAITLESLNAAVLNEEESGFRVVQVNEGNVAHQWIPLSNYRSSTQESRY
jgi:3',5'-cyclic AMP phosphodiesterase CpdA